MQPVVKRGVSPIMKGIAALVIVGAIAIAVLMYTRGPADGAVDPSAAALPAASTQPNAWSLAPPKPKPIAHATRLEPDERKQLAGRIAQAQAERGALSATKRPSLPEAAPTLDPSNPEQARATIRSAMHEALELLGDCYDKAIPSLPTTKTEVVAKLTLTGDPDVGTIIDAHQMLDEAGKPLPTGFDDCLRDTMQHIALPPLEGGNKLDVTYPFVFSH